MKSIFEDIGDYVPSAAKVPREKERERYRERDRERERERERDREHERDREREREREREEEKKRHSYFEKPKADDEVSTYLYLSVCLNIYHLSHKIETLSGPKFN